MKKAKRTLALILTLGLLITMASCKDTSAAEKKTPNTTATTVKEEPEQSEATMTEESKSESDETSTAITTTVAEDSETESKPEETTTVAEDSETDSQAEETTTVAEENEPTTQEITIDSLSAENAQLFGQFINEKGLVGHFDDVANVTGKCYFIPNDDCINMESVVYPDLNKSVMMLCPIHEAYSYLDANIVDMLKGQGYTLVAFRDWTEEEKNNYEAMYNYVPPCMYIEWTDEFTEKYIDDYVFVVEN